MIKNQSMGLNFFLDNHFLGMKICEKIIEGRKWFYGWFPGMQLSITLPLELESCFPQKFKYLPWEKHPSLCNYVFFWPSCSRKKDNSKKVP